MSFYELLRVRRLESELDQLKTQAVEAVDRAKVRAIYARQAEQTTEARIAALEERLFALGLYSRTILQLLIDKGVIQVDEFNAEMRTLDLLDGKEDGR